MATLTVCDQCGKPLRADHDDGWYVVDPVGGYTVPLDQANKPPWHFCSAVCLAVWANRRKVGA